MLVIMITIIGLVRLLRSYCNREKATEQLRSLLVKARSEAVKRPTTSTSVRRGPTRLSAEINAAIVADYQSGMKSTQIRSEEHTSELQSLMRISYAVFCLKTTRSRNTTENT